MAALLRAYLVDGVPFEAWNLADGTVKNNTMAAATAETVTVTRFSVVRVIANADCWLNFTTTATVPTDDTTVNFYVPAAQEVWFSTLDTPTSFSIISATDGAIVQTVYWPNSTN